MGTRSADYATPLKLALTSPTSGGRSVGIVRWRTKAPEFLFLSGGTKENTDNLNHDSLSVDRFSNVRISEHETSLLSTTETPNVIRICVIIRLILRSSLLPGNQTKLQLDRGLAVTIL
jgi:hypothetical protein